MKTAIKAVEEGQSISQAACDHGIPNTTLYDRVYGRVKHGTNPGPQPDSTTDLIVRTVSGRKGAPPRARLLTSATAFEVFK